MKLHPRWLHVAIWLVASLFLYLVIRDYYFGAVLMGNPPSFASKRQVVFWAGTVIALAGWLWLGWMAASGRTPRRLLTAWNSVQARTPGWLRAIIAGLLLLVPAYIFLFSAVGLYDLHYWARLGALVIFALLASLIAFRWTGVWDGILRWAVLLLLAGAAFTASGWLNRVTAYPFSLSWSEGNRMWDYSMMFPGSRYQVIGEITARPYISIGRQFLWAVPFLFSSTGIVAARLWDALLWIVPAGLLGWALVAGKERSWLLKLIAAVWAFVYLAQGPIYAPLLVSALLVVLALRARWLWLAALLVLAAGYYGALSRTTWAYAPGLWGGLLALLAIESPGFRRGRWKELLRPVALGVAGYLGGQIVPGIVEWAVNGFETASPVALIQDAAAMVSHQPLLWDRLLPNPTFPPGILLAALWAGLPLIIFLVVLRVRGLWRPNWMQTLAVILVALAFGTVGIIASVKIGGGSNLHNMDMFWITLLMVALSVYPPQSLPFGYASRPKNQKPSLGGAREVILAALCLVLVAPVTYNAAYGTPLDVASAQQADEALVSMRKIINAAAQRGEVLFIDQRQLLTFQQIQTPLVTEYEKKYLMDQAMADNQKYFERFWKDLREQRFVMIVTEPIRSTVLDAEDARNFSEENNAWVKWVSAPLLQYYEAANYYEEVGVQLLVPRKDPAP